MLKFDGKIVQFGFGAVGKSFYEKIREEIKFDEYKYFVISANKFESDAFISLGGMASNFIVSEIKKENFEEIFGNLLDEGDLLIDFADAVGTLDICNWCAENNIMYLNTGEADWPEIWYSIFDENTSKCALKEKYKNYPDKNKHPIVLQHGDNPGLVSHFVKLGIEYIYKTQLKKDKVLRNLIKEKRYNMAAKHIGIKIIQENDIDTQDINEKFDLQTLYNTWCPDSFFFEMLSESTINMGLDESTEIFDKIKYYDKEKGYLELENMAIDTKVKAYYPNGKFEGFLVPHEETITIANSMQVVENGKVVYRPTVMFVYLPCNYAQRYFEKSKVNSYPNVDLNKPQDCNDINGTVISRGYIYPKKSEIVYKEKINSGTEFVGVLLLGERFDPVWIGNRVEPEFLYKKKNSYWQSPTITPVSMSALSAVYWMIKNKEKGGIYFPEDIDDYKDIIKFSEKYISKIVYKTFDKNLIEKELNIQFDNLNIKNLF